MTISEGLMMLMYRESIHKCVSMKKKEKYKYLFSIPSLCNILHKFSYLALTSQKLSEARRLNRRYQEMF